MNYLIITDNPLYGLNEIDSPLPSEMTEDELHADEESSDEALPPSKAAFSTLSRSFMPLKENNPGCRLGGRATALNPELPSSSTSRAKHKAKSILKKETGWERISSSRRVRFDESRNSEITINQEDLHYSRALPHQRRSPFSKHREALKRVQKKKQGSSGVSSKETNDLAHKKVRRRRIRRRSRTNTE